MEPTRREVIAAGVTLGLALTAGRAAGQTGMRMRTAESGDDAGATLRELLARNRENHPIYGGGLANHLSMELCALAALGASSQRLREFARNYSRMLVPFPKDGARVTQADWRSAIGHADALHGLAAYFAQDLRERGRERALGDALVELAPSLSSELFHGLIRTAYGVQFDDVDEIAHGLAYWAIKPLPLGELAKTPGSERDFLALLARVRATPALADAQLAGNSNPGRMQQASRLEGFAAAVDAFGVDATSLDQLGRGTLALFATTRDFTALHAVTATHALRIVLPYHPDRERMLRHHVQGLLAAYVRMGAPDIDAQFPSEAPGWDAITARALDSSDDHDAKFTWTCRDEQAARGDELYRLAAARRVERA